MGGFLVHLVKYTSFLINHRILYNRADYSRIWTALRAGPFLQHVVMTQRHNVTKAVTTIWLFTTQWRAAGCGVHITQESTRDAESQTLLQTSWNAVCNLTRFQVNPIQFKLWDALICFLGLKTCISSLMCPKYYLGRKLSSSIGREKFMAPTMCNFKLNFI